MVLDYSKWDALELSDDSDIEVHPNVDKKSFIRAKQAQIHQERDRRRHQIKTLKYERIINDGLTLRIHRLLTALKSHRADDASSSSADAAVFQSMMESMAEMGEDRPPPPPDGVHEHVKEKPTYPQMMASLVDTVKKEVDESKTDDRLHAFISGLEGHEAKVAGLQKELLAKLAELEKEDKKHITSDDIHTGFDFSNVKVGAAEASAAPKSQTETVELLNPPKRPEASRTDTGQSSGADADIEDDAVDEDSVEASLLGQKFAQIKIGDYSACMDFISKNPSILAEKETDGLLVEAFNSELDGKHKHARQCVHQGLLLQYCRQLGGMNGVAIFFKRITTKDHQANKLFTDDVDSTYRRIKTRAAEILRERAENPQSAEGVEQIQLHAVDPNTTINIAVPPPTPTSADPGEREVEAASRAIFETFPPGLQRALESGSLDEVNKVLAKMSVEEAEEIVDKLGQGGMLSLEQGVIDATTEEGKRAMEEIERTHHMPGQEGVELAPDPE
ncbi:Hsp90 co-chaperone-like protein Cdc37 [Polyplosphaeria fusca]|uniref:Hsp90 chaperone protein kinase-targeting subunit n=1 Tax=Polyplosphaeria fusca TaxID=682080 RepID=A0A9P4UWD7_9PLEO|nr:Hsp90 co-chaperone-like protein Cdc37 [Polyplosphaeria fusca]